MGGVLLTALALLTAASGDKPKEEGFDALGVPLVAYNSDVGFGFGAVGGAYIYRKGYKPYRHAISAQAYATTFGVQNHFIRYDGPSLLGPLRFEAKAEWRRELKSPYYGPGNQSSPGFDTTSDFSDPRYNFDKLAPGGWVRVRGAPLGEGHPLQLYGGYGFRWQRNIVFSGSLLEEQQPTGISGGSLGQVLLGALFDSRDNEGDPTRGGAEELSVRLAARATGSAYQFAGVTLSERRVVSLGTPKLLLAGRLLVDLMWGEVPFFDWSTTAGLFPTDGVGGMSSVRGLPRNRYTGNAKGLLNLELRYYPYAFPVFGAPVKLGAVAFADFGRVWHPGVDDGGGLGVHPALGGGLRVARRAAVVRFDLGLSTETRLLRVYITFGHAY